MTSNQFIQSVIKYVLVVLVGFAGVNLYVNDFGLFGDRESVRVWTDEKTSKYLMSFNYIPDNFDTILIGPSVSVNMDTRLIEGHKVYNLSMNSGNITELKYAVDNVIKKGHLKTIIICLYPYMIKNSGIKGRQINIKEYWGSLYSIIPIRMYLRRVKNLIWPEKDIYHSSDWGFADSNLLKKHLNFEDYVIKRRAAVKTDLPIDRIAVEQLKSIVDMAHKKKIKVLAYYYPVYYEYLEEFKASGAWANYQKEMSNVFSDKDTVWDMNLSEYKHLTNSFSSYSDGHLSDLGASMVLGDIGMKLNSLSN